MAGYAFTPKRVREYEKLVAQHALEARPADWPLDAEYHVFVAVYRAARRGDIDNLGKSALDGCNRILWDDDRRIAELHLLRIDGDPDPRVMVEVQAT